MQSTKIQPKMMMKSPRVTKRQPDLPAMMENNNNRYVDDGVENDVVEDEDDDDEYYEEKVSYTAAPRSRSSRGVSTDELQKPKTQQKYRENRKSPVSELTTLDGSPPPPSTTSSNHSDKANDNIAASSKRYEDVGGGDGDPIITESTTEVPLIVSRNSMLLQLIACGSSLAFKSKINNNNNNNYKNNRKQLAAAAAAAVGRKSNCSDLHKGVLCKNAAVMVEEEGEEEEEMIKCMSENPRFGNLQSEEKEYFSGSIVDAMSTEERAHNTNPSLKKSSSYNEGRYQILLHFFIFI